MEKIPEDRCGYMIFDEELPRELSGVCCYLPTWKNKNWCIWHSEDKTGAEIQEAIAERPEYIYGANLNGISVTGLDFSDCKLAKSDLSNSTLEDCDFSNSSLWNAEIRNSSLVGNDFSGVDFSDSNISLSDFSQSNLNYTHFNYVSMNRVDFTGTTIENSEFLYADAYNSTFTKAEIDGAVFSKSYLSFSDFSDITCYNSTFDDATIHTTNFNSSRVTSSTFLRSDLTGVDFTDVDSRYSLFERANLEDATFIRTDLRNANLQYAGLYQTIFSDTRINNNTNFGSESAYENPNSELKKESAYEDTSRFEAAAWVYRRLEDLHEENAMSEKAREYHIRKEEAKRHEYRENGEWFKWGAHTANYNLTEHGENLWQVAKWSGITIGAGTVLYPLLGGIENAEGTHNLWSLSDPAVWDVLLVFARSLYFSTVTFTTLGYGDYHPVGPTAKALAGVESLAGALLVALFVFVLGRRVAR